MAIELRRKTSTRRIKNPDGDGSDSDSDIILQVIDELTFLVPERQYQEITWIFDNTDTADIKNKREVHVVTVKGPKTDDDDNPLPVGEQGDSKLEVERIDAFTVRVPEEQYWEHRYTLDNKSEDRFAPDYEPPASDKRKTHDVKIMSKDGSAWIKVRRTDSFMMTANYDQQYWETRFTLLNTDEDAGDPPPNDLDPPIKDYDGTTINPPWRLDPYQNIIDVSWGGLAVKFSEKAT